MSEKKTAKRYGNIAKLPKMTDPDMFMEKIKNPKNKLWYVLVERQDNELLLVKYNNNEGVDLVQFTDDLIQHYFKQAGDNSSIRSMKVALNEKFSVIRNIPDINVIITHENGTKSEKKLITKITEDLIKLLK